MTEEEMLKIMDVTIKSLLKGIRPFGYYSKTHGDLSQQAYLFAVEAINSGKYDEKRPLGGFLRTCIINRFISLSRDKFRRTEQPCSRCIFRDEHMKVNQSGCQVFDNKLKCEKYKEYHERNKMKMSLMSMKGEPLYEQTLLRDNKDIVDVDEKDLAENIQSKLSDESKETFKELLEGKKIKKCRLDKLEEEWKILNSDGSKEDGGISVST